MTKKSDLNELFEKELLPLQEEKNNAAHAAVISCVAEENTRPGIPFNVLTTAIENLNRSSSDQKRFMTLSDFEHYLALQRMELQMGRISPDECNRLIQEATKEYYFYCMAVYLVHHEKKSYRAMQKILQVDYPKLGTWVGKDRRWPHRFRHINHQNNPLKNEKSKRPYFSYMLGLYTGMFSSFVIRQKRLPTRIGFSSKNKKKLQQIVQVIAQLTDDHPRIYPRKEKDGSVCYLAHYDNPFINAMIMQSTNGMQSLPWEYVHTPEEKMSFLRGMLHAGYRFFFMHVTTRQVNERCVYLLAEDCPPMFVKISVCC